MNAASSLFTALPPSMPGSSAPSTPDQSAAPLAGTESFLSVMSQVEPDGFSNSFGQAGNPDTDSFPAETPDDTVKGGSSVSSTLLAAMIQSPGTGESRKATSSQTASSKTKTSGSGASATDASNPFATPPDIALLSVLAQPQIAAVPFLKPASVQTGNFKVAPTGQEDHKTGAGTKTSGTDAPVTARPASEHKPEMAGPVPKKIDPSPAGTAASTKAVAARPAEPAAPPPQPVTAQIAKAPSTGLDPADGTGGALSSQRMNFTGEKNEIAGPAAQKVPGAPAKDAFAIQAANDLAGASTSDHSGHQQDATDPSQMMGWPAKAGELNANAANGAGPAASGNHAATVAERVGHLVSQQAVTIRQSGANNLAVSLKLDPHTELNLQLTNHNGQIEASVRFERGAVAGLDSHWKDLQDSLARQNVQLLPLENKTVSRTPSFNAASDQGTASFLKQSPQNPQRQGRGTRQDSPPAVVVVQNVPATNKATTRTASRQGWESWA
jgi:hypothetical protein